MCRGDAGSVMGGPDRHDSSRARRSRGSASYAMMRETETLEEEE